MRLPLVSAGANVPSPMRPELLSQIPPDEAIASVGGVRHQDLSYGNNPAQRARHHPPRKNAIVWKGTQTGVTSRNEALLDCQRLGRRIWQKWSHYHRRSLVETEMNCFKRLGERVMARTFEHQVTQLHIRVALLNRFSQLGRPVTVAVG